jgi:hypothetical protein
MFQQVIDPLLPWTFHVVTPFRLVMIHVKCGIALQHYGMQIEAVLHREREANISLTRERSTQLGAQLIQQLQQERSVYTYTYIYNVMMLSMHEIFTAVICVSCSV